MGKALARDWLRASRFTPAQVTVKRRQTDRLADLYQKDYTVRADSAKAIATSDLIMLAVQPRQLASLLADIAPHIDAARQRVGSVVSNASIADIRGALDEARVCSILSAERSSSRKT